MAKRNSSSTSGNRRGSSRTSTGKSFSGSKSTGRSFNKSDRDDSKKPFDKRNKGASSERPYKKFDDNKSSKPSFGKREDGPKRTFGKTSSARGGHDRTGKAFEKPFNRSARGESESSPRPRITKNFSKPFDKPSSFKKEGDVNDRERKSPRGFSSSSTNRDSSESKPPYKKFDRPVRDNNSTENKRPRYSGASERPTRSRSQDKDSGVGKDESSDRPSKGESYGLPYKRSYTKKTSSGDDDKDKSDSAKSDRPYPRKYKSKRVTSDEAPHQDSDIIRLNRYIANSGICSRREADEYISMGLVSVNGKVVTELGHKVKRSDEVRYEDKVLKAEKPVYILMNKPKGFLTTTKDPQERNTIMHIIGNNVKERVYPVGRLDRNTTGLLLLTNDGDLADKLMHPSYNVKKIYKVELDKPLTKADFIKIREGVRLEEGKAIVDDLAIVSDDNKTIGIELHIGWNRVVRRIFESLDYQVVKLDRSVYAGLDKKELSRGQWRFLKKEEIVLLKHYK